jgi:ArsR family transcriptional regulator
MNMMVQETINRLKALSDPGRLQVMKLLYAAGELCVCRIEEALDLPQPTVSRHLKLLKTAGWLEDRRKGKWVYYRLPEDMDPAWRSILEIVIRESGSAYINKIGSSPKSSLFCNE